METGPVWRYESRDGSGARHRRHFSLLDEQKNDTYGRFAMYKNGADATKHEKDTHGFVNGGKE